MLSRTPATAALDRWTHRFAKRYRAWRQPRRGVDLCADLRLVMRPRLIFDVGANVGQTAVRFRRCFPRATIHCFEPAAASAQRIRARRLAKVEVHERALGSRAGTAALARGADPATFRLAETGDERVRVDTIDSFCRAHGIERIDLLKIDTEGHDLEVLRGAAEMLAAGRIAAVQVEAGLNPDNDFHVPFELLKAHLEGHGLRLFGIYDQVSEWPTRQPHLRRANPLFVSRQIYAR